MDPYRVLDVPKDADTDTIKKRYRKLARETHPDLNPGDAAAEARFKEVSVAYDVLSDPERRRAFDEFGEISLEGGFDAEQARAQKERFGERFGRPDAGSFEGQFGFGDLDDLLRQFGRGGNAGGPFEREFRARGGDLESEITLDFLDALRGGEREFVIDRPRADGSTFKQTVKVRIPPGITDGGRLRIPGRGGEGIGGAPDGDLWLHTRVRSHPIFRRKGSNLELDLPLRLSEAVLGTAIDVPTPDGEVKLTVPPGTSSHQRLRLRGRGVPAHGGRPAGDLFAVVKIVTPKDVPDSLREALEGLDEPDPREASES